MGGVIVEVGMDEEHASWPSKDQVMQDLGISERTLDRRVNELSINKVFRQAIGRKPIPLLDPAGVARLKELHERPNPVTVKTPPRQLPQVYQNGHGGAKQTETPLLPVPLIEAATTYLQRLPDIQTPPMIPPALSQAVMEWFANLTGPQYLTLKDAAMQTGLPQSHIRQAIKEKRIHAVKVARSWRLLRGDVVAYRVTE